MSGSGTLTVTILHARQDEPSLQKLLSQLSAYLKSGRINVWHRGMLLWGNIAEEVRKRTESAQLIVLLISADLLAEHFADIQRALLMQGRGTIVVPVLCRPVMLEGSPLEGLVTLPHDTAVSQYSDKDQGWATVARNLSKAIDSLVGKPLSWEPLSSPSPPLVSDEIRILFLSSSPLDGPPLDTGRDLAQISRSLERFGSRSRFSLDQEWAATREGLIQKLLKSRPRIVHFSGHGTHSGHIVLEDGAGKGHKIPSEPLARTFATLNKADPQQPIQCVVLSACYAEPQALALAEHVDCVVGVSDKLHDTSAASFSAGFYSALVAGLSFGAAFELGRIQIELLGQPPAELHLHVRPGQDAMKMRLVPSPA